MSTLVDKYLAAAEDTLFVARGASNSPAALKRTLDLASEACALEIKGLKRLERAVNRTLEA